MERVWIDFSGGPHFSPVSLRADRHEHRRFSQLFRLRNANVTSNFGSHDRSPRSHGTCPHGFSCQTNSLNGDTRGFRRLRAATTTKCQSLNEHCYFIFSLSLSSFLFSFLQLVSLSPSRRCSAPICTRNTIPRSNTRTRPWGEVRVHYSRLVSFFFFSPLLFLILLKLSAVFCYFTFFLSVFVRSIRFVRYIYIHTRLSRTFSSSAFEDNAGNVQFVFMNG